MNNGRCGLVRNAVVLVATTIALGTQASQGTATPSKLNGGVGASRVNRINDTVGMELQEAGDRTRIVGQDREETVIQEWTLGRPRLEVGLAGDPLQLHQVVSAALVRDGGVAIADAGNYRIAVVSKEGDLVRVLGRRGDGPGEFRDLTKMFLASGDTLVTYDWRRGRVGIWAVETGEMLDFRLPTVDGYKVVVDGAVNGSTLLVRSTEFRGSGADGLYRAESTVLLYWPRSDSVRVIEKRAAEYHYLITERFGENQRGTSTYRPPFLGTAHFAAAGHHYAVVPLDSALVLMSPLPAAATRRVPLPIPVWSLNTEAVRRTRDSLLVANEAWRWGGNRARRRIQRVYSDNFPLPDYGPAVRRLLAINGDFWVESFRQPNDEYRRWFVIDPIAGTLVAKVDVPATERLLSGNEHSVVVLTHTSMDEEFVRIRDIERPSL